MSIIGIVAILLMIPLVAMQFTSEVKWTLSDFMVAAVLLLGTGFAYNYIAKAAKDNKYRPAMIAALLIAFVLVWAELAVGIFNTPFAGN